MRKTEKILAILQNELRGGKYKQGGLFPSEHSLMNRFGVSRITVNKITEHLVGGGFLKRGVRGSGTVVIETSPFPLGQIAYFGSIDHPHYMKIVDGIQRTAFAMEYGVNIFAIGMDMTNYCLEKISRAKYIGLLTSGTGMAPENFPLPVVYLDSSVPNDTKQRASVTCANKKGAMDIAGAVMKRGHREIVVVSNKSPAEFSREKRIEGFICAMEKYGINDAKSRCFVFPAYDCQAMKRELKSVLAKFPGATTIMTDSDDVAFLILQALRGTKHEGKITVTGFGNLKWVSGMYRLPGVEQHPFDIGAQGVAELVRLANGQPPGPEIEIETETVNTDEIPYMDRLQ